MFVLSDCHWATTSPRVGLAEQRKLPGSFAAAGRRFCAAPPDREGLAIKEYTR
jgi:hypothetical protein